MDHICGVYRRAEVVEQLSVPHNKVALDRAENPENFENNTLAFALCAATSHEEKDMRRPPKLLAQFRLARRLPVARQIRKVLCAPLLIGEIRLDEHGQIQLEQLPWQKYQGWSEFELDQGRMIIVVLSSPVRSCLKE